MKDTMNLKDGTVIEMEAGAALGAVVVLSADRNAMATTWAKLTPDNLSKVQFKNGTGEEVGTYSELVLESETSTVSEDGAVTTEYHLREKTRLEKAEDEIKALKTGQEVQDGAISDLGSVTSALAEQMGGEQ